MLLDLLRTDNYVSFNKRLAHIIGLEQSIYVNQIINIMGKAQKKNKVYKDGFIKLDRKYIFEQTTLTIEEQLKLDKSLVNIKLLEVDFDDNDLIKVDTQLLADITSNEDVSINTDLSSIIQGNTKLDTRTKNLLRCDNLSRFIDTNNSELTHSLQDWIMALIENNKPVNKTTVTKFQDDLFNYTQGKLSDALELVKIATINAYKEFSWCIKIFEKEKTIKLNNEPKEVAKEENLSSIVF